MEPIRGVEKDYIHAEIAKNICTHLASVPEAMKCFHIYHHWRIFNIEETGIAFKKIASCRLWHGVETKCRDFFTTLAHTEGHLDRLT